MERLDGWRGHDVGAAVSGGRRNVHRPSALFRTCNGLVASRKCDHPRNDSPYIFSTMAKFGKFGVWSAAVADV